MRKVVLTFGLIAGAMLSAMMLVTLPFQDRIGFDNGEIIGYTTMVLSFMLVFFGFTHCPEVCPTTLFDISEILNKLGPDAAKVNAVFITWFTKSWIILSMRPWWVTAISSMSPFTSITASPWSTTA